MDWWKAPILQGDDNEYGDYDYLIEEIPSDKAEWSFFEQKCDCCGKYRKAVFCYTHYFHTLDGWDSHEHSECWRCRVKSSIHSKKWKLKCKLRAAKYAASCIIKEKKYGMKDFKWLYKLFLK